MVLDHSASTVAFSEMGMLLSRNAARTLSMHGLDLDRAGLDFAVLALERCLLAVVPAWAPCRSARARSCPGPTRTVAKPCAKLLELRRLALEPGLDACEAAQLRLLVVPRVEQLAELLLRTREVLLVGRACSPSGSSTQSFPPVAEAGHEPVNADSP